MQEHFFSSTLAYISIERLWHDIYHLDSALQRHTQQIVGRQRRGIIDSSYKGDHGSQQLPESERSAIFLCHALFQAVIRELKA